MNAFFHAYKYLLTPCNGSINQEINTTLIQNVLRCHFLPVSIPCMTFYYLEIKEINDDSGSVVYTPELKTKRSFIFTVRSTVRNYPVIGAFLNSFRAVFRVEPPSSNSSSRVPRSSPSPTLQINILPAFKVAYNSIIEIQ